MPNGQRHLGLAINSWLGQMLKTIAVAGLMYAVTACGGDARFGRVDVPHNHVIAIRLPVALVPELEAGGAGWVVCVRPGAFGCHSTYAFDGRWPMVSTSWGAEGPDMVTRGIAVTEPQVKAVAIDRLMSPVDVQRPKWAPVRGTGVLPTYGESGLFGLRVVAVEIFGTLPLEKGRIGGPVFLPLNSRGHEIPFGPVLRSQILVAPVVKVHGAIYSKGWPCRIASSPGGPRPFASQAVTALKPRQDIAGGGFISCASAEYKVGGWTIVASVLVNARKPGARPAMLPGMRPMAGRPNVFEAPGREGPVLARRVKGGWLVVAEGHTIEQRQSIFDHVEAEVTED